MRCDYCGGILRTVTWTKTAFELFGREVESVRLSVRCCTGCGRTVDDDGDQRSLFEEVA